jgi:hypothetical protein
MDKYPIVNNPGVYQSGQPNLLCNIQKISLVLPAQTIPSPSISEIFQHHDAILGLANDRAEIEPESLSWPLGQVHEILECPHC